MKNLYRLLLIAALTAAVTSCFEERENLARFRLATASSSFDNNLTAQLLTDGIVIDGMPAYLEVFTPAGEAGKTAREYTLDQDTNSKFTVEGSRGWIEYLPHGYVIEADSVRVLCRETLPDGHGGETREETLPIRMKGDTLRVDLSFPREAVWQVKEVDFLHAGKSLGSVLPSEQFSSAWMSEGCDSEWVAIDLGHVCKIDRINIHWLNKAAEHGIFISCDNESYKAFNAPDTARFVKVTMKDAMGGKPFCISEIEVFGPKAEKTARNGWKLCRASSVCIEDYELSYVGVDTGDWLDATVPGTVLQSFIDAGAVPDPDFGDNISQISESYFNSDFWYRREYDLTRPSEGRHLHLRFDGINWKAEVFFNGNRLGRIDGAFARADFDVTDLVADGCNVLAVKIIRNAHPGAVKTRTKQWTGYNGGILGADNPTFHASIGWDWIASIRGRNCGIWNDVNFVETGCATVKDPLVQSHLNQDNSVDMTVSVMVETNDPVIVEGWIGDVRFSKIATSSGQLDFSPKDCPQLSSCPMKLWWPNAYGEPFLYEAGFFVRDVKGEVSDSLCYKAGIREVKWSTENDVLLLYVNGRRISPLGGNWGFSQQNLNFPRDKYFTAADYHRQMNFNMIRNWVGQVGDDEFYEACDSCGILVWQDFWLANPYDGPDPYDEAMFLANARDLTLRIRRHPCVTLYCGRNEGFPPASLDSALRKETVASLHPGIPYISSSADIVVSGHGPYRAMPPEYYFLDQSGKFHSERGIPVIPVAESMRKFMAQDDLWPYSAMWGKHDFTEAGAQRAVTYMEMMEKLFGTFDNVDDFCKYAQWLNYDLTRAMFEADGACRRNGLLLWMSHSAWPSMAFCTYDYYFQPGGAFFGSRKGCEPIHIQYNPLTDMIEVVNRCSGDNRSLTASMTTYDLKGEAVRTESASLDSANDSTTECFPAGNANGGEVNLISLKLTDKTGKVLSENFYILGSESGSLKAARSLGEPTLDCKVEMGLSLARIRVKNVGNTPALRLRIVLQDKDGNEILPVKYSDNYICLMPLEEKTVSISWRPGVEAASVTVI